MSSTPDWLKDVSENGRSNVDDSSPSWIDETAQSTSPAPNATPPQTYKSPETGLAPMEQEQMNSNEDAKQKKTWGQYFSETMKRDGRLVLITVAILICVNIPYVRWVLYPFTIFSTWIHELCHGLAAEMVGGNIRKLEIFPDGSGLAHSVLSNRDRLGFVISAGYQGTAVVGFLLLLVRRTKRGPRTGCMVLALMMILSVLLWIRNFFGVAYGLVMGLALAAVAVFMPSKHMRNVFVLLAVTCSLNAITSVQNLFGKNHFVNGEPSRTDAHSMADSNGGTSAMWATLWLLFSIVLTIVGILFAVPGADEIADFTVCGICQDMGCFTLCNARGRRMFSSLFRTSSPSADPNNVAESPSQSTDKV